MKRIHLVRALVLVVVAALAFLPSLFAAKPIRSSTVPLNIHVYDSVIDEHDTTAFYNNGTAFCSGLVNPADISAFTGDGVVAGPTSAYSTGAPWTATTNLSSTTYSDKADCGNNCLRAQFNSNDKILSFDTRGTVGPRKVKLDFSHPCQGCAGPAGSPGVFGGSITTDGLLDVYLDFPYTSMEVCTSTACPEAQPAFAKFWFTDPSDTSVTWRVDWQFLRVLRISTDTWYVIADSCDGTQIAGLSSLTGKRSRPKTVFNGYYLIPFFHAAVKK